jgi:hypothetical protein
MKLEYSNLNLKENISDTPPDLADWMVKLAEIQKFDHILEPSAGKGNICQAIKKVLSKPWLYFCELNETNYHLLRAMDICCLSRDFMQLDNEWHAFDRIIMNPPLKHTTEHIEKAFGLLNPGGKMVCLIHGICLNAESYPKFHNWFINQKSRSYQVNNNKYFSGHSGVNALVLVIDK